LINRKLSKNNKCLLIGRWQPFHKGHITLIQSALDDGMDIVVGVRDTAFSKKNPYSFSERVKMIKKHFPDAEIIKIPDILEVRYGRDVGYRIVEKRLDRKIESISGTKIRGGK